MKKMRHFVFMKFKPGEFTEEAFSEIRDTFSALQKELPEEILSCRVLKNCVDREWNMDLLIEMELYSAESLPKYLKHPLHTGLGKRMDEHIAERRSFDAE